MRVLVTGHLGYIGTVLTPFLADLGYDVVGYDTGYYAECFLGDKTNSKVSLQINKDIRKVEKSDILGIDAIVHLAALSNDPTGQLNPRLTNEINTVGTLRLGEIARKVGVEKFIFSSSCSIYGQSDEKALTEESPMNPQTAYARSKVDSEAGLRKMATKSFSPIFLRNATAYGFSPRLRFDLAVNNLTGWGFTTGQVKLLSDGRAWRPMVHVEDICQAIVEVLKAPKDLVHNQAFNVGSSRENYQIRDIAQMAAQIVPDCKVTFAEGASADNRTYNVSFDKIKHTLPNFDLRWSVLQGIEQLHNAFISTSLTYSLFDGRLFTRLKQINYLLESGAINSDLFWKTKLTQKEGVL
jgi:nucleoside-diphosphate-sugar epimerase